MVEVLLSLRGRHRGPGGGSHISQLKAEGGEPPPEPQVDRRGPPRLQQRKITCTKMNFTIRTTI